MTIRFYIAKRHVPATCLVCGNPTRVVQDKERCFAGSRLWRQVTCFACIFKKLAAIYREPYDDLLKHANPFLAMIRKPGETFQGAHYPLPLMVTKK